MPGRLWRPVMLLLCVAGAVFAVAQGQFFAPSATTGAAPTAPGDPSQGQLIFAETCAGCHGDGGLGGGIGPRLAGAGLSAELIQSRIERGAGLMPAGLVGGKKEADVIAYVIGITTK